MFLYVFHLSFRNSTSSFAGEHFIDNPNATSNNNRPSYWHPIFPYILIPSSLYIDETFPPAPYWHPQDFPKRNPNGHVRNEIKCLSWILKLRTIPVFFLQCLCCLDPCHFSKRSSSHLQNQSMFFFQNR